jgi:hypothetical protein
MWVNGLFVGAIVLVLAGTFVFIVRVLSGMVVWGSRVVRHDTTESASG